MTFAFTAHTERNVVGGGYFRVVSLYRDDALIGRWSYDGTLWPWLADRRVRRKVTDLRLMYDAKPR